MWMSLQSLFQVRRIITYNVFLFFRENGTQCECIIYLWFTRFFFCLEKSP